MAADLPPVVIEERVQCSIAAALRYNIPANVMLAVAEQENGRPGARVQNTNNTRAGKIVAAATENTGVTNSRISAGLRVAM